MSWTASTPFTRPHHYFKIANKPHVRTRTFEFENILSYFIDSFNNKINPSLFDVRVFMVE